MKPTKEQMEAAIKDAGWRKVVLNGEKSHYTHLRYSDGGLPVKTLEQAFEDSVTQEHIKREERQRQAEIKRMERMDIFPIENFGINYCDKARILFDKETGSFRELQHEKKSGGWHDIYLNDIASYDIDDYVAAVAEPLYAEIKRLREQKK